MRWPFGKKAETKSLANPDSELMAVFGITSGIGMLAPSVALQVPAVAAAVRIISEAAASLDVTVKKRVGDKEEDVPEHPALKLLSGSANPWTSGYELIRDLVAQALTHDAGGLAWVNRVRGKPIEVIRYRPGLLAVEYDSNGSGEPSYRLGSKKLKQGDVVHLRGLFDRCPLNMASTAIGLAHALEAYGAHLFSNGARPGGVLETPKPIGDEGVKKLVAGWRAAHEGGVNSGKTAVLWDGTTYKPLAMDSTDAQYIENRTFQILEIARAFRVPPGMLFELSRNTWSNSEQQAKEFIQYTLVPWVRALEAALNRALLTDEERANHRIAFDIDDTSQADLTARATAISTLITAKVLNSNEARDWLGMEPRDGGNVYENPSVLAKQQPGNDNKPPIMEAA